MVSSGLCLLIARQNFRTLFKEVWNFFQVSYKIFSLSNFTGNKKNPANFFFLTAAKKIVCLVRWFDEIEKLIGLKHLNS